MRRPLIALTLAALCAAAWWIVKPSGEGAGLVVHLEVVDEDGKPLQRAQVERVFENQRVTLDASGKALLVNVVLRELDEPSATSIARAVRVHAPYHALRRGLLPSIKRRDDGGWDMRMQMHAHGVFRIYVDQTHHGACKAFLEPDRQLRRFEPIEGRQVARDKSPAAYRVYRGIEKLVVRVEGVADKDGAVGVATRKHVFDAPPLGHVVEQVIKPEGVKQILGQVRVKEGATPPSLAGKVTVIQLEDDGGRVPLGVVTVRDDGSFIARRTGEGTYELQADLDFFPGITTTKVLGGALFDLVPSEPAAFVVLEHPGLDTRLRKAFFLLKQTADAPGTFGHPHHPSFGDGQTTIALHAPGKFHVGMHVHGTKAHPPLAGGVSVDATSGTARARVELAEQPHGTLVIKTTSGSWSNVRGATANLGPRTATLMRSLRETVTFENVSVGASIVFVRWDDKEEPDGLTYLIKAGETTTVIFDRAPKTSSSKDMK